MGAQCDGGMAEKVRVSRRNVLRKPASLSFVEAAAAPVVFITAWHMLVARAQIAVGETVLIQAADSGAKRASPQGAAGGGAHPLFGLGAAWALSGIPEPQEAVASSRQPLWKEFRQSLKGEGYRRLTGVVFTKNLFLGMTGPFLIVYFKRRFLEGTAAAKLRVERLVRELLAMMAEVRVGKMSGKVRLKLPDHHRWAKAVAAGIEKHYPRNGWPTIWRQS